jgi:preprotein translocase subunit YajC
MSEQTLSTLGLVIFFVVIFGAMYLFMIRPRQRQQKVHEEMMKELRPGDKVVIAGGIYGQIESLSEDTAILRIESGATMKVARNSILGKQEIEESGKGIF